MGEGSAIPTDPHHTPTFIQPSTQHQKTQKPRKPKRKDTQVPRPSDLIESVADEAVHKELGDSLVRAATTASSLEAKLDSGGGPRGNTLQSDEDRLKLDELMELCTTLQNQVLDLEKTKTTQHNEIANLERRVKKLEKKNSLGEDASKQGRKIDDIDADEEIILVSFHDMKVLLEMKIKKPKKKGIVIQELGESTIKMSSQLSSQQSHDKGKGILIKPLKPMKKKDQISLDEEIALNLQAEFDEEERLAREKAKKEKEANIALIKHDDISGKR
ncbi:hypothetical protein Tco_0038818 [Tanacetum coccineum]